MIGRREARSDQARMPRLVERLVLRRCAVPGNSGQEKDRGEEQAFMH